MDCREADRLIQLRLDHEIDEEERLELELHVVECPVCRRREDSARWVHSGVRQKLCESVESMEAAPPDELRARVLQEIRQEQRPRAMWPKAAAAVVVVISAGGLFSFSARSESDPVLEETIARHSSNLPPEVRASSFDPAEVDRFLSRNLRYKVDVPRFKKSRMPVRLVGARLASIKDRDVAYLMYDHRGAKLSLFAYPGNSGQAKTAGFQERRAGRRVVRVGKRRGYNVVSWKDDVRNLSYSLVSDVDSSELVRLASDAP